MWRNIEENFCDSHVFKIKSASPEFFVRGRIPAVLRSFGAAGKGNFPAGKKRKIKKLKKSVDKRISLWYYKQAVKRRQDKPEWRNWQTHRT
ncbi:hypothetical protein [Anaerotignum lactatifermentans]|uniref:Uncharacterized protein n=1 Tax=Anaerotignum lactatifermentans TaxID=160404 RepID=A0ABS2GDY9_9FIRM|nr:hypothetical protein [Anaerotignum lactatifermentans]MBM6830136.1 hypothetical protein [Anaerotignum lactatifermentans]MBM6878719.1 hypothetical protein [Anaerotignum lactatifermentans]